MIPRLSSSKFLFHITGYNIRWIDVWQDQATKFQYLQLYTC
jgi:hypothetical protein